MKEGESETEAKFGLRKQRIFVFNLDRVVINSNFFLIALDY